MFLEEVRSVEESLRSIHPYHEDCPLIKELLRQRFVDSNGTAVTDFARAYILKEKTSRGTYLIEYTYFKQVGKRQLC